MYTSAFSSLSASIHAARLSRHRSDAIGPAERPLALRRSFQNWFKGSHRRRLRGQDTRPRTNCNRSRVRAKVERIFGVIEWVSLSHDNHEERLNGRLHDNCDGDSDSASTRRGLPLMRAVNRECIGQQTAQLRTLALEN